MLLDPFEPAKGYNVSHLGLTIHEIAVVVVSKAAVQQSRDAKSSHISISIFHHAHKESHKARKITRTLVQ